MTPRERLTILEMPYLRPVSADNGRIRDRGYQLHRMHGAQRHGGRGGD